MPQNAGEAFWIESVTPADANKRHVKSGTRTPICMFACWIPLQLPRAWCWNSSTDKVISDKSDQEMYLVVCHCNERQTSLSWLHLICHSSCFMPQRLHSSTTPVCTFIRANDRYGTKTTAETRCSSRGNEDMERQILNSHFLRQSNILISSNFFSSFFFALKYLCACLEISYERTLCTSSVDWESAGWPVSPRARAALSERARAGGVRGLWTLTIWPLGGWFPHWLPLFPANNWDLIWEEISKALVTPLLRSDRFPSLVLKETSLRPMLLCGGREWLRFGSGHCLCATVACRPFISQTGKWNRLWE